MTNAVDISSEEETSILNIARTCFGKLGWGVGYPRHIVWVYEGIDPDKPLLLRNERLELRGELEGKLTTTEWRPLLMSSILIRLRMGKRNSVNDVAPVLGAFATVGLIMWILLIDVLPILPRGVDSGPKGGLAGLVLILLLLVVPILFLRVTGSYRRRFRYRADEWVSNEFGLRNELVQVLEKIDGMTLTFARSMNISRQATPRQRIDNLLSGGKK